MHELAEDRSLVLLVDDADDLDRSSIGALVAAWGRRPFPLVTATRPYATLEEGRASLSAAVSPVVRMAVPALSYEETAQLAESLLGGPIEATTAGRVHAKSGGMPGLADAIVRAARRGQRLVEVDGTWRARGELWTPDLGEVVDHLLVGLEGPALHAVRSLALTGPVSTTAAGRIVPWSVLEELDARSLLRTLPQGRTTLVGLYPPLIAEHLRHAGRDTVMMRLSREIEEAFSQDASPEDAAAISSEGALRRAHAVESFSTVEGRERAVVLDRYLAQQAARLQLVRAAEWRDEPTPTTATRYLETLLMVGANQAVAKRIVAETPEVGDPLAVVQLRSLAAIQLAILEGDMPAARASLRRPLPTEVMAADPDTADILELLGRRLGLTLEKVPADPIPACAGGPVVTTLRTLVEAETLVTTGSADDAVRILRDLEPEARLADDALEPQFSVLARPRAVARGLALLLTGDARGSLAWASRHMDEAMAGQDIEGLWAHGYVKAFALALAGRFDELRDHVGTVLSLGLIPARQAQLAVGNLVIGAFVALRQGRTEAARMLARQARGVSRLPGPWPFMSIGWFDGVAAAMAAADPRGEADAFWQEAEVLAERGYTVAAAAMGVLSLEAMPDGERARRVRDMLDGSHSLGLEALAQLAEVIVGDDPAPALRLYRLALRHGAGLYAARALHHALRGLRARGDEDEAGRLVAEVRADDLLPDAMVSAIDEIDALDGTTAREREVALLVESGMTNQQIAGRLLISTSTVENHLNRVYRKLGIDGRAELVTRLRQRVRY
ncbi:LuxR C-terminal-related transcriptional regulator [Isoptericola sp. NPDC056618]|uniref:helix-turn-helix transcriptional regulator n=1 Tax=unclassified Isoptericola TaxID=2623355 RepID=UPI003649E500